MGQVRLGINLERRTIGLDGLGNQVGGLLPVAHFPLIYEGKTEIVMGHCPVLRKVRFCIDLQRCPVSFDPLGKQIRRLRATAAQPLVD